MLFCPNEALFFEILFSADGILLLFPFSINILTRWGKIYFKQNKKQCQWHVNICKITISRKIWSAVGTKQWPFNFSRRVQRYSSVFSTFPNYFPIEEYLMELFREAAFQQVDKFHAGLVLLECNVRFQEFDCLLLGFQFVQLVDYTIVFISIVAKYLSNEKKTIV
jgi:hypothetical protein